MKIKLLCALILIFSGCLNSTPTLLDGKYISNNSDSFQFDENNIFYAIEYPKFTRQPVEFSGTYKVVDNELILTYKMFGIIRRFQISNNSHTLIENDGMKFDWEKK